MEIKIKPNYASIDYKNIPGTYTFYQNFNNNETWIYSSVDIPVNTNIRVTQDGGNIAFGTIQSSTPFFALYILVIKRTQGNIIGFPNVILSIDEIVESASFYLDGTIEILLNYKIFDVKDLKRSAPYTKTIEVPFTDNNNKIFSQIFNVNVSQGYNPKKKSDCEITDGGVLIVSGFIQVQEIDIPNKLYKCVFYGEFKNLFGDIGDNLIFGNADITKDLDFSDIIHNKFQSVIESSWNGNEQFVYGLVNNGSTNWNPIAKPFISTGDLYPFVRAKYVIDKIFNKWGYTYESTFLNSDIFTNLLSLPSTRATTGSDIVKVGFDPTIGTYSIGTQSSPTNIPLDKIITDIYGSSYNIGTYRFRIPFSTNSLKLNAAINFEQGVPTVISKSTSIVSSGVEYWSNTGFIVVEATIYRSGTAIVNRREITRVNERRRERFAAGGPGGNTGGRVLVGEDVFKIPSIQIKDYNLDYNFLVNDEIEFKIWNGVELHQPTRAGATTSLAPNFTYIGSKLNIDANTTFTRFETDFIAISSSDYNQNISPIYNGVKQIDFISDIIKMFNLYIVQDKTNPKKFIIEPRDIFYGLSEVVDYLEYDYESANISYLTDVASKRYKLTYAKGDDLQNKTFQDINPDRVFGDAIINIDNDYLTNEKKIELVSQATFLDNVIKNYWAPSLIPTSGTNGSFKNRFLYYGGTNSWTSPQLFALRTGLTSSAFATYSYFPSIDIYLDYRIDISQSLVFSRSSIDSIKESSLYYTYYENEIETYALATSHILTISAYMNTAIFSKINFNNLFYLEINGNAQYYILLSLENYNPAEPGMVTMKLLSYHNVINSPKRDESIIDVGVVLNPGDLEPQGLIGGGKNNVIVDNNAYKYQIIGDNNIVESGKETVFVYGDNNIIEASNVVTYDSGKTHSTPNTFNFGLMNPVLTAQNYVGVTSTPGMMVYGGTDTLYIKGTDNSWYAITLTKLD